MFYKTPSWMLYNNIYVSLKTPSQKPSGKIEKRIYCTVTYTAHVASLKILINLLGKFNKGESKMLINSSKILSCLLDL
jgi:hypothetical protein